MDTDQHGWEGDERGGAEWEEVRKGEEKQRRGGDLLKLEQLLHNDEPAFFENSIKLRTPLCAYILWCRIGKELALRRAQPDTAPEPSTGVRAGPGWQRSVEHPLGVFPDHQQRAGGRPLGHAGGRASVARSGCSALIVHPKLFTTWMAGAKSAPPAKW